MEGEGLEITTTKRIKSLEEEEDRISSLPDCLIIEILSRLPYTKQAIRTCVLSKRWQHLWTFVHTFIFNEWLDVGKKHSLSDYFSFVDKSLSQCQSKLHKLKISTFTEYDKWHVNNWIRLAINRNVQQLSGDMFVLIDDLFFNTSCFTHLELKYCKFNPTGDISWENLKFLYIADARLDENLVQNILSGSPLLETLKLEDCYGFRRLEITSKSVKNVFFYRYYLLDDNFEINAPYVLSLMISMTYLSFLKRLLLLDVSSLIEVNLRCFFTSYPYLGEEDVLKRFILKCSHANEFNITEKWSKVLSHLEAKGFIFPSNLKVLDVISPLYSDSDSTDLDDSSDDDSSSSDSSGSESVESIDSENLMPDNDSEGDEVN